MNEIRRKFPWATTALIIAITGNIVATLIPIPSLLQIPPGSRVRLMDDTAHMLFVSLATLLLAWSLSFASLRKKQQPRWISFAALFLALTPFFVSGWVMNTLASMRSITFAP